MASAFTVLDPAELLARLDGEAAALTVLTPNLRLAQALTREADARKLAAGAKSWAAPDILAWSAWLVRCHDEACYSPEAAGVPALSSGAEEQLLWEEAVRASAWRESLLSIPATAALAAEAWALAHAWRIAGALASMPGSEDAEAFIDWAAHYERRTARDRLTDTARLPALVAPWLASGAIARPATLLLYAFDLLTPQQDDLFCECARLGVEVLACRAPKVAGEVTRVVPESPRREIDQAARWARSRLERAQADGRGAPRLAVIVPDLAKRRAEVERGFARVFAPGGQGGAEGYVNISAGEPLAARPLVDAALAILDLADGPIDFDRASRLIRSPFIGAAEAERQARARLDAALRETAPARLTLRRLRALAAEAASRRGGAGCPRLIAHLDSVLAAASASPRAAPQEWARRFTAILETAGWPGERTLDSPEYQGLEKFREALSDLAALGNVAASWSGPEARAHLGRIATQTIFQPASGDAPVQVLGILESAGLAFNHLWASGLTEDAWPIATRLNPLIAPALQRIAGIPQASAEKSLEVDRALTEAWKGAAPEVVFSSAAADGDRELLPSPLIAGIAASGIEALAIPDYPALRDALFEAGREAGAITTSTDDVAPPLGEEAAHGGTGILADQAACPFRAFAHHRLDASDLERPEPGLDHLERGKLLHAMMARIWKRLRDRATLEATAPAALGEIIRDGAESAVARVRADRPGCLEDRFAALEVARLEAIAREWLALELQRPPFEVVLREEKMTLAAGNLRLRGRVDRMDRLEGGGLAVIDYKSGEARTSAWVGPRPDDVQLPLYALAAEEEVRAVAFARLKTGKLGFEGLSREEGLLPDVSTTAKSRGPARRFATWAELLGHWREETARLGENFASGDARVDPKKALDTCQRCDLAPLCRVHERLGALGEGEAREEEGE